MAKSVKDLRGEFIQEFVKLWYKSPERAKAVFGYRVPNARDARDVAIDLVGPIEDDPEATTPEKREAIRGYIDHARMHLALDDFDYRAVINLIAGHRVMVEGDYEGKGGRRSKADDANYHARVALWRETEAHLAARWGIKLDEHGMA